MFNDMMKRTLDDKKPLSDAEIRKMAYRDWIDVLSQLWEATGKPVNDKQLAVYAKQLRNVPMSVLEDVVGVLLREHTWNNVPTIGEIWKCIQDRHGDPDNLIVKERPWVWRLMGEGNMPEVLSE
jgi:hypothetical protein